MGEIRRTGNPAGPASERGRRVGVEGDATVEEGGREMESGIDASRRGPMPGSHFRTDTGGPACATERERDRDGWIDR